MYYFSYFKTKDESMYISRSIDGYTWENEEKVLTGTIGTKTLRDPFVFKDEIGLYHMLSTNGWMSKYIVHATSIDLKSWSEQKLIPVMESIKGTCNSWAPECIYDKKNQVYVIFWSSTVKKSIISKRKNHRIWAVTTKNFVDFSDPFILFDPGHNVIDATMLYHNGKVIMAFKDERGVNLPNTKHKGIKIAVADNPLGPFKVVTDIISPQLVEGPTLYKINNEIVMLFDHFMEGRYGAMISSDGINWSTDDRFILPKDARHGCVFK